jgi:hypothetical protein
MSGYSKRNNLMIPSFQVYNGLATTGLFTDRTGANISSSTDFAWEGTNSIKITAGTAGFFDISQGYTTNYFYKVPSTVYTFSAYLRRADGGNISLTDLAQVLIYTTDIQMNAQVKSITKDINNWFRAVGTTSGLSGLTTLVQVGFLFGGALIGSTVYVDAWQVETGPYATPWESITAGDRQHNKWKSK